MSLPKRISTCIKLSTLLDQQRVTSNGYPGQTEHKVMCSNSPGKAHLYNAGLVPNTKINNEN